MADIAKLVARLELQSTQFQTELEKTNKKLLGFQRQSSASLKGIENSFKSFYRVMQVGIAGVGVAALANVAKNAITVGDELNKAAIKAGIAGSAMSELAHAAKMSDIDLGDLSNSLRFMQVNLSKAAEGSKEQVRAFNELGVSVETLKRLAPDKQFELLAGRIASVRDPADKARVAVEIFGKAGASLLPLFAKGAAGIREAREEAKRLGVALSDEQIKKLAEADDAVKALSAAWAGFATTMTSKVAPALSAVLKSLTELADGKAMERVGQTYRQNAIAQYGTDEQKAALRASQLEAELGGRFSGPTQRSRFGANRVSGNAGGASNAGNQIPSVFLEEVRTTALTYAEFQKNLRDQSAMDDYIAGLQSAYETQRALFEDSDKGISDLFSDTTASINEQLGDVVYQSRETTDEFAVLWQRAGERSFDAVSNFLFDPLNDGLKGFASSFLDTMRRLLADQATLQLFKVFGKYGENNKGTILGSIASSLFGGFRASGGPVSSGKAYLVGERGPELFMPGASGAISPNGMGAVSVVMNIDARGATTESITPLKAIAKQISESTEARIIDGLRRKRYAGV